MTRARMRVVAWVAVGIVAAFGLWQAHQAESTNRAAIRAIRVDRLLRIRQINQVALTLCGYSRENRALQRRGIREQPMVVTDRFRLAGASPAQIREVRADTQKRTDRLLLRYPAIVCPRSYVTTRR